VARPVVQRLKRLKAAQLFKSYVWTPYRLRNVPLLSVVVPFHDSVRQLPRTLESLLAQHDQKLEIILVDDGSTDGSRQVADGYAKRHRNIRVVEQAHAGVGAARNRGVLHARGEYLAFCDSDDRVVSGGYARLVRVLRWSGSDLAVGSVAVQVKGKYQTPAWANRSNARRQVAVSAEEVPEIFGNLMLGARVFRRSAWDAQGWRFTRDDERSDPCLVVSSLLGTGTLDVLPSVVYRWSFREDNRSLLQRDLRDAGRVADRVRGFRRAGEIVVARGPEPVQSTYFSEVLHTVIPDLVRAAVCRENGYWEALVGEVAGLVDTMSRDSFLDVPVEDRVISWLCSRNERAATEEFLEYAFDNQRGHPFRIEDGRPHIALPFIDVLSGASADLTRVADSDMAFVARVVRVGWADERVLRIEGAAYAEYLDDRLGPSSVTLVVTERSTGEERRVAAKPLPEVEVNRWAARANEDHTGAGFVAEIDFADLPTTDPKRTAFDVDVELSIGGFTRSGPFRSRHVGGSAGLLEPHVVEGTRMTATWRDHRGLGLVVTTGVEPRAPRVRSVVADTLDLQDGRLSITGTSITDIEVRLLGPRGATDWVPAKREGDGFSVSVSLLVDEWGLGATSLPADTYQLQARLADGRQVAVRTARELWRTMPRQLDSGEWTVTPLVGDGARLTVRVVPVEWQYCRPPMFRRRLRDELYPAAKQAPLLNTVLFETFAGRGTGDNPGAICAEFHRRGLDLDLAYSVIDRSNVVPEGARAVVRWSPEWFELLGRARYLVVNASLPYFFRKREGQLYYQTWHGSPLKRIAHDRPHLDFFNWHHRRQLLVARDGWDFLLSQSEFCTTALSSAFRYEGPVMEVGYPRNDILLAEHREEVRRRVRAHFGIAEGTRAVLYAPTWRDNLRVGAVFDKVLYLDPEQVVETLDDTVVLVRGHYNSVGAAERRGATRQVLDVTRYPDIADLYLAADVLVTDYSSVFFDFAITDKPMIFLAPDLKEYRDDNRGFYLDYHETVPGPICLSTREVIETLRGEDRYATRRADFRDRFAPLDDGQAAARVVDGILAAHPLLKGVSRDGGLVDSGA
jgi:CDP-glycerol glycerophosphotransferase (TagB/SpsB family)/glycosyltransferase involved in cell wall biosynthesis